MSTTTPRRFPLPLLSAVLGVGAAAVGADGLVLAGVLLFCPGWGATRLLSVADRNFGVYGSAVCLSMILLGLASRLPLLDSPWVVVGLTLVLCVIGTLRMRRHDLWLAADPPHPAPMPLWPARTPACLVLGGLTLAAVVWARPLGTAAFDGAHLLGAAESVGWTAGGEDPLVAGTALPADTLFSSAAATLSAATRLHPLVCVALLASTCLSAVLAFVAEGISRLWGNRGGTRAMLAFVVGMNPLGTFFMLGASDVEGARAAMSPSFDVGITAALQPFVDASPLALTLALVAMMQSCTLSILRRSSTHIPRLLAVATFGLVLNAPEAAMLLVPGWVLGIGLSHVACLGSIDNDPQLNASVRRRGEPATLRSPFWRPVLHLVAGLGVAALIVPVPDLPPQADVRSVAWALLAAVGPTCLLFMPGIRHLNASPGREAYHFVGLVATTVVLLLTFDLFGDEGNVGVRLLSLLLAVPCANGAMKMIEVHGFRARMCLALLVVGLLPTSVIVLWAAQRAPPVIVVDVEPGAVPTLGDDIVTGFDAALLGAVRDALPDRAVLALDAPPADPTRAAFVSLAVDAPLLAARTTGAEAARRRLLVERLGRGDATASWTLLETPSLARRPLYAIAGDVWPGFELLWRDGGGRVVQRARRDHVVLVTADRLRAGELDAQALADALGTSAVPAMVFEQAVTPSPSPGAALDAALRAGDATAPAVLAARGMRVAAWVPADLGVGPDLAEDFGDGWHTTPSDATAVELAEAALDWVAELPDDAAFAWIHVAGADAETVRDDLGGALYRLVAGLGPRARVIVTAPRGRPRADAPDGPIPAALTEDALRVPFVILGGGAPATRATRLVSVADVGALLTSGDLPHRDEIELRWTDATGRSYTGLRTRHAKTIDVRATDERPAGTWTVDLTTPHGETTPTWAPREEPVSSASGP